MTEPVSEERQKAYFEKARKGVLAWLASRDGAAATLGEMHDHSSEKFLVAHQGFSKMMEGFVADRREHLVGVLADAGGRSIDGPWWAKVKAASRRSASRPPSGLRSRAMARLFEPWVRNPVPISALFNA